MSCGPSTFIMGSYAHRRRPPLRRFTSLSHGKRLPICNEQRTSLPQHAGAEQPLLNLVVDRFGSKTVIASVTGKETDPQGYSRQV